jgi:uncharacterized protein with PQ loop repeat
MGECISTVVEQIGFGFGLLSTVIWMYAQVPQLILNFRHRSVIGLSAGFMTLLVCGDVMNLVGVILTGGMATQFITASWFILVDGSVCCQILYYSWLRPKCHSSEDDPAPGNLVGPGFSPIPLLVAGGYAASSNPYDKDHFLGSLLGWGSAVCYLGSRTPQIYTNFKRKTTQGVSMQFFLSAICANITYAASILLREPSWSYLWQQFPWLLGSVGNLGFDAVVLVQFYLYRPARIQAHALLRNDNEPKVALVDERGEMLDSLMS